MNRYLVRVWIDDIIIEAETPEQAEEKLLMAISDVVSIPPRPEKVQLRVLVSELAGAVEHFAGKTESGLLEG